MMTLSNAYFVLLFFSLALMLIQLLVKQKRLEHLFFAIFSGSMAMVAAQQLSAATLGPYQYLIGLGACATCNGMWLTSKAMFSGENSITKKHIVFALVIAALVIINNSLHMAYEFSALAKNTYALFDNALGELTNLLSSTVLALTCWEALKGTLDKTKQDFWPRIMFLAAFCTGVMLCTVVAKSLFTPEQLTQVRPWLVVIAALQIMLVTQIILWYQQYKSLVKAVEPSANIKCLRNDVSDIDQSLIAGINALLIENKRYLTQNLKMIDLANELSVSEYKISRAIRYHFAAPNFNNFINCLRVEHAKNLLEQPESQHWTILVIALESGFSSLATFNRVFKTELGYAPNEHRKGIRVACVNK